MNNQLISENRIYDRLAKVALSGFLIQFIWYLISSPITSNQWERPRSWIMLGLAVVLIALVPSGLFKRIIKAKASESSLPMQIFIANGLSLLLMVVVFLILLESSPKILDDLQHATEAAAEYGLIILILVSIIANIIAYSLDRRVFK